MKCEFCGFEFEESVAHNLCGSCVGCISKHHCELVNCPNCNYSLTKTPKWLSSLLNRLSKKNGHIKDQAVSLDRFQLNRKAVVSYLNTEDRDVLHKMIALGVLPDTVIEIKHNFPAFVFKIGNTQLTVDRTLAQVIYVKEHQNGCC